MGELLEAIADPDNLRAAWAKVRANARAGGIDGQTVAAFAADEDHQLVSLRRRLLSAERYVPPPVRRVEIPKPDGRMRPLGIPTVALLGSRTGSGNEADAPPRCPLNG